jgi:hypothetical protein
MEVARSEDNGRRVADPVGSEGRPAGQPHFNGEAAPHVLSCKACRQSGSIVRDHKVTRPQQIDESRSR